MARKPRFNYREDKFGKVCLKLAHNKKSRDSWAFVAVLVKDGKIIGRSWNRRSTGWDRIRLPHVDYATHAEQACVIDALNHNRDIKGAEIYVVGLWLGKKEDGDLTVTKEKKFGCKKCPKTFLLFDIPVNIPQTYGWFRLSPQEAQETAKGFKVP